MELRRRLLRGGRGRGPLVSTAASASHGCARQETVGRGGVNGTSMKPPEGESGPRPPTRSNRILGLLAAVGFSVAMWAFIAMAVIGLILKIVGPKDAEEGLSAAGASVSQFFNPDSKAPETEPETGL